MSSQSCNYRLRCSKKCFAARSFTLVAMLLLLGTQGSKAGFLKNWVNTSGGSWFDPNNWSPSAVPTNGDAVTITNNGTYTVYAPTGKVSCAVFTIGGASGKQTFVYGSTNGQILMTNSVVQSNGVLVLTNGGVTGALLVQPGGELDFNSHSSMSLNNLALTNQGVVMWTNGDLVTGIAGAPPANTFITNSGLWEIGAPSGLKMIPGTGGNISYFYNSGAVQKTNGQFFNCTMGITFINLPAGTVDVTRGTLTLNGEGTNVLGGTFTTTSQGGLIFTGNQTDGGSTMTGSGLFQFWLGNLYLRSDIDPALSLIGGDVYITGTTTFQAGGAITSLALGSAILHGTNQIAGTMSVIEGSILDQMTVLPGGQLVVLGSMSLYAPLFINLGTVVCGGSGVTYGGMPQTVISNVGTWNFVRNSYLQNAGVGSFAFTNAGIVEKTGGSQISDLTAFPFVNLPSGVIRVETGTLRMPYNYTNLAGEIQLVGGVLSVFNSTNYMTGGTLDGFGMIGSPAVFYGGTISPEPLIQFKSGLTLGTNVTLVMDGSGTEAGFSYDQLSVGGAVAISNATLQMTSLPDVPLGTTFVIIDNTTTNMTSGSFNDLPENGALIVGGQLFRIHYSGGDGNDVVLVRDSTPELFSGGYTNQMFKVLGVGSAAATYTIQASTNLLQWTNVGLATGDIGGNFNFTDTNATNFRYRFYRTTN
jgi:hypothetical protein